MTAVTAMTTATNPGYLLSYTDFYFSLVSLAIFYRGGSALYYSSVYDTPDVKFDVLQALGGS